jgi:hypothetical protein
VAVRALAAAGPDLIAVVGGGPAGGEYEAGAATGTRMCGRLLCMAHPYGVTYLVACWERPGAD